MEGKPIEHMTSARIPTDFGLFQLALYRSHTDDKEHLALVMGEVAGQTEVLVRIHSECFTGDVLGSRRCDCGPQLRHAMQQIAGAGRGVIVYLRQEGRGIGLADKLRAYNLQEMGYDTVDANLMLGHQADARDYTAAAHILHDLDVRSVKLLTNNPDKIAGMQAAGIPVVARLPLTTAVTPENAAYLKTKVEKMRHLLDLDTMLVANGVARPLLSRPFVTLSYAQSLDGSIAARRGQPTPLSGPEAMHMTHHLRASHDAILVGIGTVLADDPRLTVRLVDGDQPQPVVVDGRLRFPLTAQLLQHPKRPFIMTTTQADESRQRDLESAGAEVIRVAAAPDGRVSLSAVLAILQGRGLRSLMVEGGAQIITSFLTAHLVDRVVITIAPRLLGGLPAITYLNGHTLPTLHNAHYRQLGADMVLMGDVGAGG